MSLSPIADVAAAEAAQRILEEIREGEPAA
jgi:hypothetical protein